jgi:hypothetical protein
MYYNHCHRATAHLQLNILLLLLLLLLLLRRVCAVEKQYVLHILLLCVCVCVALFIEHAKRMSRIIHRWPVRLYHIFHIISYKARYSKNTFLDINYVRRKSSRYVRGIFIILILNCNVQHNSLFIAIEATCFDLIRWSSSGLHQNMSSDAVYILGSQLSTLLYMAEFHYM